jgi:hypothetical protein
VTKYLVIGALLSLLILLVYSRLYPYIQAFKKVLGIAKGLAEPRNAANDSNSTAVKADQKLVRCVSCGTWVPAGRAIGGMGASVYCSRDCIERMSGGKERKIAG